MASYWIAAPNISGIWSPAVIKDKGLSNREVSELYGQYGHLVHRRCVVILRHDALADDAMQNTFIKVMKYGKSIRAADSALRWLYRVADRCCFDLLGKRKRLGEVSVPVSLSEPSHGGVVEARDEVMKFLNGLSARDREVAVLAYVDELNQGEIAQVLGLSRVTINKRLGAIRKRLAKRRGRHDR